MDASTANQITVTHDVCIWSKEEHLAWISPAKIIRLLQLIKGCVINNIRE